MLLGGVAASLIAAAPSLAAKAETSGEPAKAQPPNIVYIISDDQGWKDVGYHGSDIKTPNIDALAASGARLEQFYAQPMCTPTRAALMTGRYPFRYGLQTAVIPSSHTWGLPTDEWLLPQALKDAATRRRLSANGTSVTPIRNTGRASAGSITNMGRSLANSTISRMSSTVCSTGIGTTSRCGSRVIRRRSSARPRSN
jgi:hypothetical protein